MSINAIVRTVYHYENGRGRLALDGPERGQAQLFFDSAPHDVTALNGLQVWGSDNSLMHGESEIARREGYTKIVFTVDSLGEVVAKEHRRRQERQTT